MKAAVKEALNSAVLDEGFNTPRSEAYFAIALQLEIAFERYEYLGCGISRHCFDLGDGWVLKIADTTYHVKANENELHLYSKYGDARLAPCERVPVDGDGGRALAIRMRKVWIAAQTHGEREELVASGDMPEWANDIDGAQVGMLDGRWVAYDYAYETNRAHEWAGGDPTPAESGVRERFVRAVDMAVAPWRRP